MTKTQKIWLWVSMAMFVVPEVLWGDLIQAFKLPFLPVYKNVQLFTDRPLLAFLIIIFETSGVLVALCILNKKNTNSGYLKYISNVVLVFILLALMLSLYFSYVMSQISFP